MRQNVYTLLICCVIVVKHFVYGIQGFIRNAGKLAAPCTFGFLEALFDCSLHLFHLIHIIASKCACEVKKTGSCLLYAVITVLCDVCLCLRSSCRIYLRLAAC